ncbi:hypothetical protein GOV05_01520 [Candidatus Woesearchaeota archaeon]|nr:hypothetical protein [Candidatus Woesearchaeota archaeon]
MNKKIILLTTIGILILAATVLAGDGPIGPQAVENITSTRMNESTWTPYNITALAGNITYMNIYAWTNTRTWQGYYGNITGVIVLADVNNNTMYDWTDADPSGQIYATRNNNLDWSNIACAAQSELDVDEADFTGANETDRDGKYPMDAPNRTFMPAGGVIGVNAEPANFSDIAEIYVGPVNIDPSTCLTTSMHNSTEYVRGSQNAGNDPRHFREVVLATAGGTGDIVYTAILEKNWDSFDGKTADFEMIVGEDGHGTDTAVTSYYFFVELT